MRVLVTGASGFLGSYVAERLSAAGHELRLLLRRTSSLAFLENVRYERAEGDVRDPASLAAAVAGVEAIVHLAAATSAISEGEFHEVNAGGTASLAVAAVAADVPRFVHVSSLAAQGPGLDGVPREAQDVVPAPVSAHGRSKLASEQAVLVLAREMNVAVLRAPAVYGPRDRGFLPFFRVISRARFMPVLGDGHNRFSWVYVTDAASAIEAMLNSEAPSGRIYGISDGAVHTWNELSSTLIDVVGKRVYRLKVPSSVFAVLGAAGSFGQVVARRSMLFSLDKYSELVQRNWLIGHEQISAELGWQPQIDSEEGLRRTVGWYEERGWL